MKNYTKRKTVYSRRNKGIMGMRTCIKYLISIILLNIVSINLFGGGFFETTSAETTSKVDNIFTFNINKTNGTTAVNLNVNGYRNVSILRRYYNPVTKYTYYYLFKAGKTGIEFDTTSGNALYEQTDTGNIRPYDQYPAWLQAMNLNGQIKTGGLNKTIVDQYLNKQALSDLTYNKFQFEFYNYGPQTLDILLIYEKDGSTDDFNYERIEENQFIEFFEGEEDALKLMCSANNDYDSQIQKANGYKSLALSLMYYLLFYGTPEASTFETIIKDTSTFSGITFYSNGPNNTIDVANITSLQSAYREKLKKSMNSHLSAAFEEPLFKGAVSKLKNSNNEDFKLPTMKFGNSIYNDLYLEWDASQIISKPQNSRNHYLSAYFQLLYQLQKPPLASFIQQLQEEIKDDNNLPLYPYNYKDYTMLTPSEGGLLAENALRFLTWGVEYTPFNPINSSLTIYPNKPVFEANKANIEKWISDSHNGIAQNNYYPDLTGTPPPISGSETVPIITTVNPIHILNGPTSSTNSLILAGLKKADQPLNISKIDLWSSKNLLWENNISADEIVAGNSEGSTEYFNNKQRTDSVSITPVNNKISVGYNFAQSQQVQGLLLMGGINGKDTSKVSVSYNDGTEDLTITKDWHSLRREDIKTLKVSSTAPTPTPNPTPSTKTSTIDYDKEALFDQETHNKKAWVVDKRNDPNPQIDIELFRETYISNAKISFWYAKNVKIEIYTSSDGINYLPENEHKNIITNEIINLEINKPTKFIQIKITNSDDNFFSIREIEISPLQNKLTQYSTSQSNKAFLKNPLLSYSQDNREYHYYMFETPVTAESVQIDYENVNSIAVEELCVFSENPISYISWSDKNSIAFDEILRQNGTIDNPYAESLMFNTNLSQSLSYQGTAIVKKAMSLRYPKYEDGNFASYAKYKVNTKDYYHEVNDRLEIWKQPHILTNNELKEYWYYVRKTNNHEGYSSIKDETMENDIVVKTDQFAEPAWDSCLINLTFRRPIFFKQAVIWEAGSASAMEHEFRLFTDKTEYLAELFLKYQSQGLTNSNITFTSPFENQAAGNPLPYAPAGIDSPRTFAFKMNEQYKANQFLKGSHWTSDLVSTRALDTTSDSIIENYEQFYATEMDIINRVTNTKLRIKKDLIYLANYPQNPDSDITDHRPFLPGLYADTPTGYKNSAQSLYQPDKSAGIDSKGLVSGALSMAGIGGVMNIFNQDISQNLGAYYSMLNKRPGLDDNGKPAFYISEENSILTGDYRLSKTDIERTTILVPDVSLIQKGDLLVNYMADNELHLGVIVDFPWAKDSDKKPGYGEDLGTLWDEIYVVSVRKGFQTVVLGTWGNGGNIFSGFSENPETYQIRRLVKQQSANIARGDKKEDWDVTGFIPKRIYTNYPAPNTYPVGHNRTNVYYPYVEYLTPKGAYDTLNNVNHDVEYHRARIGVLDRIRDGAFSYEKKQSKTDSENEKWGPVSENLFYWDYLPPTSFENKWAQSPFGPDEKMNVVGITGWRDLGWRKFEGYKDAIHPENDIEAQLIDYHTAIDITYPNSSESFLHPLYAPEDGIFYIFGTEIAKNIVVGAQNDIISDEIRINKYADNKAGFVTVFISDKKNNQDTKKGRVYLFTHCGPPLPGQATAEKPPKDVADFDSALQLFKDRFTQQYPDKSYPDSYDKAIPVKTGQWIGLLGQRGAAASVHSHLEVFEYFEKDEAFLNDWNPQKLNAEGKWVPDGIQFSYFGKWKRINPLTLFKKKDYNYIENWADNVQNLRDKSDFSQEEMGKVFRTWDNRMDKE